MENLRKIIQAHYYEPPFCCKGDLVYLTDI